MKNISKLKFLIVCLVYFTTDLSAQTVNQKIDAVMQKYVALDLFSGSVLLAKDGKILYAKAFGDENKSYQIKNTIDTKFNIASMGKMFTGVSILQLEERGKLNINDPVSNYLKDFPLGNKITIFHLLSHTSGVGSYMAHPDYRANRNAFKKINDLLSIIYDQKLEFENPGKQFSYSNSGLILLGAIIEKISGLSYSDYITKNILEPAKMKNTAMKFGDEIVQHRAMGYMKSISGEFHNTNFMTSSPFSDGGILSTVGDILKFDQALYSSVLLNDVSKQKMFTVVIPKETYGLTFQIEQRHENTVVGHGGGMPGFSSYFSRYLKDKYTIIVLSNYDMISKNVAHHIEEILYDVKYELPVQRLNQFIYENRAKIVAIASLQDISDFIVANNYSLNHPQSLNSIAYELVSDGKSDLAIKLFKLNTHLFPNEANVYDSLGEAYEGNKEYDLALQNYEKAIEVAKMNSDLSLNSFTATLERFKKEHSK